MTAPIVKEITAPPEPMTRDPFIDDVATKPSAPPAPRRRRIID